MGRRVEVDTVGFDDERAVAWMRSAEAILFPTNEASTFGRRSLACRGEVKQLRAQLEMRGVAPAAIAARVRAVIETHGFLEMVENFVNRPSVEGRSV